MRKVKRNQSPRDRTSKQPTFAQMLLIKNHDRNLFGKSVCNDAGKRRGPSA